ncbi:MAG: MCP four helix bundle domain-containing protein [Sneathiella sp.]|nr:MCP four helix bundle domain-containing protein [Sneathiella sp.]
MILIRNLSITAKLAIIFAFFVIVLVTISIKSITGLATVKENGDVIGENYLTSIVALTSVERQILLLAYAQKNHIITTDDATTKLIEKRISKAKEKATSFIAIFKETLDEGEETVAFNKFLTVYDEFLKINDKVLEYSRVNRDEDANSLSTGAFEEQVSLVHELLAVMLQTNVVGGNEYMAYNDETYSNVTTVFIGILVISFVILGFLGYFFNYTVRLPLGRIAHIVKEHSTGNLETKIPYTSMTEEIGEIANALEIFKQNAIEHKRLEMAEKDADANIRKREIEERDAKEQQLTKDRERSEQDAQAVEREERTERVTKLISNFETKIFNVLQKLDGSREEMQSMANNMTSSAGRSQSLSDNVASASEVASTNVGSAADAATELSASINEISRQVQQATGISEQAVTETEKTTSAISALAVLASNVSKVVDMISDIAGQTNLLALNATIEAARAGEAGKGFAVVASEVKSLATQTTRATKEIGDQIGGMQEASKGAVSAISNIESIIKSIRESMVSVSSAVEEQSAATSEISRNVNDAAVGTSDVSLNIAEVSNQSSETGAAASQALGAANVLGDLAGELKSDIEVFLMEVKVA